MTTMTERWQTVEDYLPHTQLIAWDGCHKIYLAMDGPEAEWFTEHYDYVFAAPAPAMLEQLHHWYDNSCGLRLISAVRRTLPDPNEGFTQLIPQFSEEDDEE